MGYHISGLISTLLYFLSVVGLWIQLQKIYDRKKTFKVGEVTAVISGNFIAMAFLAFFILFFYGFALERFNHYLVWPRLLAMVLSLTLLFEIARDRRNPKSIAIFLGCAAATLVGLTILIFDRSVALTLQGTSQATIVLITILLAQGNIHQIVRIYSTRDTGAIALRSHQLTLIKDLGTVAFGLAMGWTAGWPLILLCGSNAVFKAIILWMFRWAGRQQGLQGV